MISFQSNIQPLCITSSEVVDGPHIEMEGNWHLKDSQQLYIILPNLHQHIIATLAVVQNRSLSGQVDWSDPSDLMETRLDSILCDNDVLSFVKRQCLLETIELVIVDKNGCQACVITR